MNNMAIIGISMGDEGKARVVHYFSKWYRFCVRWGSGSNAGHTIYHKGKKIIRHLVPSTDFSISENIGFLGAGMVINLEELLQEVQETETLFPGAAKRIIVDPDAFVVFDKHIEEDKEKNKHIGSTNKGITPAYRDKIGRVGTKIRQLLKDNSNITQALQKLGVQFKHVLELKEIMERSNILFEGSQSIQLDLNFGNYPFVTSGECGLGGIYNAGFAFAPPSKVYGIAKGGYMTKAGGGVSKFTTELTEEESTFLRERGGEIGATTKRPRRIGAMDFPALKYSIIKGGITTLILTKLDVLNGIEKIKVCYDYGKSVVSGADFEDATPYYVDLPGWKDARDIEQIKPFIKHVEQFTGIPVEYVSVGVNDEDMIHLSQHESIVDNKTTIDTGQNLIKKSFNDPFENPKEQKGFVKYGEDAPTYTKELDEKFTECPSLSEVMANIIKQKAIHNKS